MENFHKYPKILNIEHRDVESIFNDGEDDIVIEEKIDGSNFRFMTPKGNVIFGSHNCELGGGKEEGKQWKRCVNHIIASLKEHPPTPDKEHYIFYGECCVPHSVQYNWDEMPPFLGFDVFDLKDEVFLKQDIAQQIFKEIGIEFVPILKILKAKDMKPITDADIPKSKYYEGPCEGMVIKNYAKQMMTKYVSDKFKEINKKAFGEIKKWAKTDDALIVAKFCTNPRIDKMIFKLVDEGKELDMPLMHHLPVRVFEDIIDENYKEILSPKHKYKLDVNSIKKRVGDRCLAVLKQIIQLNKINKEEKK